MHYIIDANNLAGQLGLLDEKDFDEKLIRIVKEYFGDKNHDINLIFDGLDRFGDKYRDGNITVIRAPRYDKDNSADDKIVEILAKTNTKGIILVTDDLELIGRVEKLEDERRIQIQKIKANDFAQKIELRLKHASINSAHGKNFDNNLSKKEIDNINEELLEIWKERQ